MPTEFSLGYFEGLQLDVRAASIQIVDGRKFLVWHCNDSKQVGIPLSCGAFLITPKDGKIEIMSESKCDNSCYPYEASKVLCQRGPDLQGA